LLSGSRCPASRTDPASALAPATAWRGHLPRRLTDPSALSG